MEARNQRLDGVDSDGNPIGCAGKTYGIQHEEHHHRRNRPCTCQNCVPVSCPFYCVIAWNVQKMSRGGSQAWQR